MQPIEKNWSPFAYKTQPEGPESTLIQCSIFPHVVANLTYTDGVPTLTHSWNTSSDVVDLWLKKHDASSVHGGVSPIPYHHRGRDVYVSIAHTTFPYRSALFVFETLPPFNILGISDSWLPLMPKDSSWSTNVAFPTQLIDDASGHFWVLYGQGDCQAQRLALTEAEFRGYLP